MIVRYYTLKEGRNKGFAVVFGEWPKGALKHRGYSDRRLTYSREATPEEEAEVNQMFRFHCVLYRNRERLLEDEASILSSEELQSLKRAIS